MNRFAPITNVDRILLGYVLYRLLDLLFAAALAGAVFLWVVSVFDYFIPWASALVR